MKRRTARLALLSLLALALGAGAYFTFSCHGGCFIMPSFFTAAAPKKNLILISIDTLRADRLPLYGNRRDTAPHLTSLATQSVVFENTFAESSWTLPSHYSMLTGLHPFTHRVNLPRDKVRPGTSLLAETLKRSEYQTAAFTDGGYVSEAFGFSRGFDTFFSKRKGFRFNIEKGMEFISSRDSKQPFFLFLHTFDVHCPYHPAEPYFSMFQSPGAEPIETKDKCGRNFFNDIAITKGQALYLLDRYDGGIRAMDSDLKLFIDFLSQQNLWEDTVLIITSDHGEELGEHGQVGHQRTLYKEALAIPLLIRAPDVNMNRIAIPVGLRDIVPTALELLGIPIEQTLDGFSLVPLLRGEPIPQRFKTREMVSTIERGGPLRALLASPWHLIFDPVPDKRELFDMIEDPLELHELSSQHTDIVPGLLERLTNEEQRLKSR